MSERITTFRGKHHFLSNFHASPVTFEGVEYPTVEHAYQAAKTDDLDKRRKIQAITTPADVKRAGAKIKPIPNWRQINMPLMTDLIRQKFTRYPDLCEQLLATGDAELIEGNDWGDDFFGMVWDETTQDWRGENRLGKMLMQVRAELQNEQ